MAVHSIVSYMYTCINRVIWPATFARRAGPPGGQNGRTDIRKIIAAVRLGGLAQLIFKFRSVIRTLIEENIV